MEHGHEESSLYNAAVAAQEAADYLTLARIAGEIVARCSASGDKLGLAWGYYFSAAAHFQRNDGTAAERAYRKAEELFTEIGNRQGIARSMLGRAAVALDINLDAAEARGLYDAAVPIVRELGDKRRLAIALGNLGEVYRLEGEGARALRSAGEAVALFREVNDPAAAGWQLASMGHYHLLRRDYAAALESMRASYPEIVRDPIPWCFAWYFDMWFIIVAALGRWELAARLLGFANHYRDIHSAPRMQGIFPWFSAPVEALHKSLEDDRFNELLAQGESLSVEQAQALVEAVGV
jgi:tetratricopeptide (TPR) repeat protein